ncbi:hypothetical protein [Erwinia oleae]
MFYLSDRLLDVIGTG